MKTYSVKDIAGMLNTNPETVRRWIRNHKLEAVQTSRKNGNVVTEAELARFITSTPKYVSKFATAVGLMTVTPILGISAIAGGIMAGIKRGSVDSNSDPDTRVRSEDIKVLLQNNIRKLDERILQKQTLIHQTEEEIAEITKQKDQFIYLLEHGDLLEDSLECTTKIMEDQ